jgi:hypothetical protein
MANHVFRDRIAATPMPATDLNSSQACHSHNPDPMKG